MTKQKWAGVTGNNMRQSVVLALLAVIYFSYSQVAMTQAEVTEVLVAEPVNTADTVAMNKVSGSTPAQAPKTEPAATAEPESVAEPEVVSKPEPAPALEPETASVPAEPTPEPKPTPESSVDTNTKTVVLNKHVETEEAEAGGAPAPIVTSSQAVPLPQAKSVELNEPVIGSEIVGQENVMAPVVEGLPPVATDEAVAPVDVDSTAEVESASPLIILGTEVLPSTTTRLSWSPSQSFEGIATPTPVLIVNGAKPGPVLCLTAALHGDELNGIEIVRRVLYNLQSENLAGSVIGVPIVNLQGFRRSSRYLTDRRDLNRYFPGNPDGSSASRIAHSFFTEVISHCDALVDLHTGSFHRTNLPQLRADVSNPQVVELTQGFGSTVVLQSGGAIGTLRRAAVDAGIPAVTLEAGEPLRLQESAVNHGVKGIRTLMNKMGMMQKFSFWGEPEPVYYNSIWVRADLGGILFSDVKLGDSINTGALLGVVTDPITNIKHEIHSPNDGRVIGMALNQVVLPGFAAFHIGIRTPDELISDPEKIDPLHKTEPTEVSPHLASSELEPSESVEGEQDMASEEIDDEIMGAKQSSVDDYD